MQNSIANFFLSSSSRETVCVPQEPVCDCQSGLTLLMEQAKCKMCLLLEKETFTRALNILWRSGNRSGIVWLRALIGLCFNGAHSGQ